MIAKIEDFESSVIVLETHAIVLVDQGGDCQPSRSWEARMPFAKGGIKKRRTFKTRRFCKEHYCKI